MKLLPTLILTLSAALLLPTAIRAEEPAPAGAAAGKHGFGGRGGNPEERIKMMTEKLGLTDDQQAKIKDVFAKDAPQIRDLLAKGRKNLTAEDHTKLRELMKGQAEAVGAILTPEQKAKWKEARASRRGERGKGA